MTRDVDPAGIMSLTEYDLAVRASERTKMSREEILKLKGVELRCEIAKALGWNKMGIDWTTPSGQVVGFLRNWHIYRRMVLQFIDTQNSRLQIRFLDELSELLNPNGQEDMEALWRGLMATPKQICQAFLLAQEKQCP